MPPLQRSLKPLEDYLIIPPWPCFDDTDIEAVSAVLRSGRVNRWAGQENELFEDEFASFTGSQHAIAVANGTVALELALHALGICQGDEVIVSSRTFIASASAIVMCGATPVVADVDPVSQNISAGTVLPLITSRTKAIIAVHLAGWPCEMPSLLGLAKEYNLKIIEDCAQAHGATYNEKPVGSLADVAAFSFCHDKIMTTGGEGGMLTTNDPELWRKAWSFKDHGKDYDATHHKSNGHGFRWLHESFGTNWRMTEMQAALGRVALRKLPEWVTIRRNHAFLLTERLNNIPGLRVTVPPQHIGHSYYKYYIFTQPRRLKPGKGRDWIMKRINAEGIPCYSGGCSEIYLEKAFVKAGLNPTERLPVARELGETSLMLLVHPTLTIQHIEKTCDVVRKIMGIAIKSKEK